MGLELAPWLPGSDVAIANCLNSRSDGRIVSLLLAWLSSHRVCFLADNAKSSHHFVYRFSTTEQPDNLHD